MAKLVSLCVAAGHRIALSIVRFLTGFRPDQADRVPGRKPRPELSSLPVEILLHIQDFLPISSAACLNLCSRHLKTVLGSRALDSLRAEDQIPERRGFLMLLQKDLPDWLFCHPCTLLHPVKVLEGPWDRWHYEGEPPCVQLKGCIYLAIDFNIRYQHAQVLMNQYRSGRSYTKHLEALSFKFSRISRNSTLEGSIWGEIVAGQLLLRFTQRFCMLPEHSIRDIQTGLHSICPHLEWLGKDKALWETIKCGLSHANKSPCTGCGMLKSCRECSTWFLTGVRELEGSKTELLIEAWKYLGSCETPFDPKWRKHARPLKRLIVRKLKDAGLWIPED